MIHIPHAILFSSSLIFTLHMLQWNFNVIQGTKRKKTFHWHATFKSNAGKCFFLGNLSQFRELLWRLKRVQKCKSTKSVPTNKKNALQIIFLVKIIFMDTSFCPSHAFAQDFSYDCISQLLYFFKLVNYLQLVNLKTPLKLDSQ